jgi:hypothetical protein
MLTVEREHVRLTVLSQFPNSYLRVKVQCMKESRQLAGQWLFAEKGGK